MDTCQSLAVACEHFVGVVAPPITAILGATTDRLVTCQEDLHWISSHASVTNVLAAGWFISILAIWYYIRQVRVDIRQLHARMDLHESQLTRGSGNSENTCIDGPSNGHSLGQSDGGALQSARGANTSEKFQVDGTPMNGHSVGQSAGNVAKPRKVQAHEGPQEEPAAARSPRPPARVIGRSDRELRNPPCTGKAYSQSELIEKPCIHPLAPGGLRILQGMVLVAVFWTWSYWIIDKPVEIFQIMQKEAILPFVGYLGYVQQLRYAFGWCAGVILIPVAVLSLSVAMGLPLVGWIWRGILAHGSWATLCSCGILDQVGYWSEVALTVSLVLLTLATYLGDALILLLLVPFVGVLGGLLDYDLESRPKREQQVLGGVKI